jgi:hypothetical protein
MFTPTKHFLLLNNYINSRAWFHFRGWVGEVDGYGVGGHLGMTSETQLSHVAADVRQWWWGIFPSRLLWAPLWALFGNACIDRYRGQIPTSWGAEPMSGCPSHPGEKMHLAPPVLDSIQPNTCLYTCVATIVIAHRGARPHVARLVWLLCSSAHSSKATPPRSPSRRRKRV